MMSRFSRQVILPGFGPKAQQKLQETKILVIGAGGLGCPALLYLAAAGIGKIGIMDGDTVSESNLNRQVLFGEAEVGINKAEAATHHLRAKYSDIKIECIPEFISPTNAINIVSRYDLVVDGSDNFSTRYLVNDACTILRKPLIFAAIYQNEGQVAIFNAYDGAVNYRDLYPEPPNEHEIPNCSETGVLGVLPGIIGAMQASEAIKYLTGYGKALVDQMLYFNLLSLETYTIDLAKNETATAMMPINERELAEMNYDIFCQNELGISWNAALKAVESNPENILIDVREPHEIPKLSQHRHINIPFSENLVLTDEIKKASGIFLFCQSGIRSQKMANFMKQQLSGKQIYSIFGGIDSPEAPLSRIKH
jgi:molybdopterin/thiamine biosynthesis adenylyltransferase/rhodanese-related sulfurtransferase